jgi:hypothetical protein
MFGALASTPLPAPDRELDDARESLAYWEARAHTLPLHAVRRRREARDMASRWQARVADAERAIYGRGLLGALVLLAAERRLPQGVRRSGAVVARRVVQALFVAFACLVALAVAGAWAFVEIVSALISALT